MAENTGRALYSGSTGRALYNPATGRALYSGVQASLLGTYAVSWTGSAWQALDSTTYYYFTSSPQSVTDPSTPHDAWQSANQNAHTHNSVAYWGEIHLVEYSTYVELRFELTDEYASYPSHIVAWRSTTGITGTYTFHSDYGFDGTSSDYTLSSPSVSEP